jgi:DNA-binding MarR family transcriptional regulator
MTFQSQLPHLSYTTSLARSWSATALSRFHLASSALQVKRRRRDAFSRPLLTLASPVHYLLTVRSQMALAAVGGRPGLNNREVSQIIGLLDQGQISRLMNRLQTQGLIENSHGHINRHVKAWRLTMDGQAVIDAYPSLRQAQRKARKGGLIPNGRPTSRSAKSKPTTPASTARTPFRLTTVGREVLTAVAHLSDGESNPSNRAIALAAGPRDEGHISKLLRRLQDHGLLENTGPVTAGAPKAWRLTPRGEELLSASSSATPPARQ